VGIVHHCEIIPFDFGKITLTTIVDGDGNPSWIADEVCKVLRYKNSRGDVTKHCFKTQIISITNRYSIRGNPNKTIINEEDLYHLITNSQLPAAMDFKRWIMGTVVPSIRQIGIYIWRTEPEGCFPPAI
jgi:anti-repressor protein